MSKKSRLYVVRECMIRRCTDTKSNQYKNYGGRGISVCDEWLVKGGDGWRNFRDWAINNGYSDELTIDRIDNDGDYTPQNCRWITRKEQNRNKRDNILIDGMILQDAAIKHGINPETLRERYHRGVRGEALYKKPKWRYVSIDGAELSLKEFAKQNNFDFRSVENAFNRGTLRNYLIQNGFDEKKAESLLTFRKERG